jgi:uncharacterized tellurite resistance protein B-like protein
MSSFFDAAKQLSSEVDNYRGLMHAGEMWQRQQQIGAAQDLVLANLEQAELQRKNLDLQRDQARHLEKQNAINEQRLVEERLERKRLEAARQAAAEVRYLISYNHHLLLENRDCPFTLAAAALIHTAIENQARAMHLQLGVDELNYHQKNAMILRSSPSAIQDACDTLNQTSHLLVKADRRLRDWLDNYQQVITTLFKSQRHPNWLAYLLSAHDELRRLLPDTRSRDEILESVKLKYRSTFPTPEISSEILADAQTAAVRLSAGFNALLSGNPRESVFSSLNNPQSVVSWSDGYVQSHSLVNPGAQSVLTFSRPPKVEHLKIECSLLLFLNIAEDVYRKDIEVGQVLYEKIKESYVAFMKSVERLDESIGQFEQVDSSLLQNPGAKISSYINNELRQIANYRSDIAQSCQNQIVNTRNGNIRQAIQMIPQLTELGERQLASQLELAIAEARRPYDHIKALMGQVEAEYERLSTPARLLWGPGIFNSYDKLEGLLHLIQREIIKFPYSQSSELGQAILKITKRLQPACELTDLCLTWTPKPESFEEIIRKSVPRNIDDNAIHINALCALASADGDFCAKEQRLIMELVTSSHVASTVASARATIVSWCDQARGNSIAKLIAQSIVDTERLGKSREKSVRLLENLKRVAVADGQATKSEATVYREIESRLINTVKKPT